MADSVDVGYFGVELNRISIKLKDYASDDMTVRADVEIVGGNGNLKWNPSDTPKESTEVVKAYKELTEAAVESEKSFLLGFAKFYRRSAYVDLAPDALNALCNAFIVIRGIRVDENPAPPANAPPPKKGAPPPVAQPVDEVLFEAWISMANLLTIRGAFLEFDGLFNDQSLSNMGVELRSVKSNLLVDGSRFAWKLFADNDLAEYAVGCSVVRWQSAMLSAPPVAWSLHYNDVVDPKAKVKPTPADFRAKYLENIQKLIETQEKVANFTLTIGAKPQDSAESNERPLLPTFTLAGGRISFDAEVAATIPVEEEIRNRADLWKVTWNQSPCMFLHRNQVRSFASSLMPMSPVSKELQVTIGKVVAAEGKALEGADISVQTVVDVSPCAAPGATVTNLVVAYPQTPEEADAGIGASSTLSLALALIPAVIPADPVESFAQATVKSRVPQPRTPADVLSGNHVGSGSSRNRDVYRELQLEITEVVTLIAQEYVWLFPNPLPKAVAPAPQVSAPPPSPGQGAAGLSAKGSSGAAAGAVAAGSTVEEGNSEAVSAIPVTQIDRQAEFMHYLSTSGIYHNFKERLKPRIQRLVRERYGARGQAVGKAPIELTGEDMTADIQSVLGELYVYLVKECNVVLNSIYTTTMVGRDAAELERGPLVNDEEETPGQAFTRLLAQAMDAEADGRPLAAEQYHLERMQLLSNESSLGSEPLSVHDAYARLGEFYLRQSSENSTVANWNNEPFKSAARQLFTKGRQALEIAVKAQPTQWRVGLTLACALVEADQHENAAILFNSVLSAQLAQGMAPGQRPGSSRSRPSTRGADVIPVVNVVMPSLDAFEGYESDKLCPADPLIYAVLAAYFSLQGDVLKTRKALVLANRSYAEAGILPHVKTHGSPRRTIVLILSQACEFLFSFGFSLIGNECYRLAVQSEASVTAKATARNMPANTVPFIKHMLKRANVAMLLGSPSQTTQQDSDASERISQAVDVANGAVDASPDPIDVAKGWIAVAKAMTIAGANAGSIADAYLRAFAFSKQAGDVMPNGARIVSLAVLSDAGKLMVQLGRYNDALGFLLPACRVHSSSSLLLLVGICCLRLERMDDAEDALLEANLLDNRNPAVWGYLSLYCLSCANNRLEEAEKSLDQAVRLGLDSTSLLRELATSFMSLDKLLIAEDLIRRTIAFEGGFPNSDAVSSSGSDNNTPSSPPNTSARSRKLLADILAAQNQAVKAVLEYKGVLSDPFADHSTKLLAADACLSLLVSLGRTDEIKAVKRIIETLNAAIASQQG